VYEVDVPRNLIKHLHFPGIFTRHNSDMGEGKDYQQIQSPEKKASLSTHQTIDLNFPVPWGHIAGIINNN
jgi:hypothetical protein